MSNSQGSQNNENNQNFDYSYMLHVLQNEMQNKNFQVILPNISKQSSSPKQNINLQISQGNNNNMSNQPQNDRFNYSYCSNFNNIEQNQIQSKQNEQIPQQNIIQNNQILDNQYQLNMNQQNRIQQNQQQLNQYQNINQNLNQNDQINYYPNLEISQRQINYNPNSIIAQRQDNNSQQYMNTLQNNQNLQYQNPINQIMPNQNQQNNYQQEYMQQYYQQQYQQLQMQLMQQSNLLNQFLQMQFSSQKYQMPNQNNQNIKQNNNQNQILNESHNIQNQQIQQQEIKQESKKKISPQNRRRSSVSRQQKQEQEKKDKELAQQVFEQLNQDYVQCGAFNPQKQCKICGNTFKEVGEVCTLYCQHQFCKDCVYMMFNTWVTSHKRLSEIVCLDDQCRKFSIEDLPLIKYILGPQKYDILEIREIKYNDQSLIFCKCNSMYYADENTKFYNCPICVNSFCVKCKEQKQGHPKNCEFKTILYILDPKNWSRDKNGELNKAVACPYCAAVWQKDGNCEKVTCRVCNNDFNFCCSSYRSPTNQHGLGWHRPDCWLRIQKMEEDEKIQEYIQQGNRDNKYDNNCEMCRKNYQTTGRQDRCEAPKALYQGVFPPELLNQFL